MKKALLLLLVFSHTLFGYDQKPIVVFDWGGVLGWSNLIILDTIQTKLELSNSKAQDLLRQYCKSVQKGTHKKFWSDWAIKHNVTLPPKFNESIRRSIRASFPQNSQMVNLARVLRGLGYRTAVCSNINEWRGILLKHLGQYDYHNPVVLSYQVGAEKPDPKIFLHLLAKIGMKAENVIFIDDYDHNVQAARRLGIDAIHYQTYTQTVNELVKRNIVVGYHVPR